MTRPEEQEQAMDMTATLTDQLADARAKHAEGVRLQKAAADMLRDVARELRDADWKGKDIAVALEVSQQRVSQLLALCRCEHPERKGYTHRKDAPCIKH